MKTDHVLHTAFIHCCHRCRCTQTAGLLSIFVFPIASDFVIQKPPHGLLHSSDHQNNETPYRMYNHSSLTIKNQLNPISLLSIHSVKTRRKQINRYRSLKTTFPTRLQRIYEQCLPAQKRHTHEIVPLHLRCLRSQCISLMLSESYALLKSLLANFRFSVNTILVFAQCRMLNK